MGEPTGKIGLEIHCYLITREKLFCMCPASRERGLKGNINICPICTGQPGAKPMMPNFEAVKKAIQIGLMLGCKINNKFLWQRKHYNWPDMPKGYQTTISGANAVPVGEKGRFCGINIWSMHLEEDPASWDPETGEVDYNRSGLPLVEIVTAPDFKNAKEVQEWLVKLIKNLGYLKAVDANAGIKADVNVNVPGKSERVEIKNISSIESIGRAIDYELERHHREGCKERETRRFDDNSGKTIRMRSKEDAEDYRFITDPDLTPIIASESLILEIKEKLPESPEEKLEKMIKRFNIDDKNAEILTKNIDIVEFFERVAAKIEPSFALPWVTIELLRVLNYNGKKLDEVEISADHFVSLLKLVREGKITPLKAKQILNEFCPKSFSPDERAKDEGKISDKIVIEGYAKEILSKNKKAVEDYKNGDRNAINFLIGEIMKATNRRADFKVAKDILEAILNAETDQ